MLSPVVAYSHASAWRSGGQPRKEDHGGDGQQVRCRYVAQSLNSTPERLQMFPCSHFMKGAFGVMKWTMTD